MTVTPARKKPRNRQAFTLVEMLTVIVIIGILAGLVTGAAIAVRIAVKRAIIVTEINQLEQAIERYKNEVGEYPPDFSFCYSSDVATATKAQAEVIRHCKKRWPRAVIDWNTIAQACAGTSGPVAATTPGAPSPATALRFWLGGVWNGSEAIGFADDPANPFKSGNPRKSYYNFTDESNKKRTTIEGLYPPDLEKPYVYFRSRNVNGKDEFGMPVGTGAAAQFLPASYPAVNSPSDPWNAVPYLEDARGGSASPAADLATLLGADPTILYSPDTTLVDRQWRNEGKYQIVCCGFDNQYATADNNGAVPPQPWRIVPDLAQANNWTDSGIWTSQGDNDNITNFAAGELEDE